MLTIVEGELGKRDVGLIPCRTKWGDIWEIDGHHLVIGRRRHSDFRKTHIAMTFRHSDHETLEHAADEWEVYLKSAVMTGETIEDMSPINGNLLIACIQTGIKYLGYVERPELADLMLDRAEFVLDTKATKLS
jgi:hypothetical protein